MESRSIVPVPNVEGELCDTIFYQGMNSSQTQLLKYSGDRKIMATTGQFMWCTGKNNLKPLDVIYQPFIGKEIEEVDLQAIHNISLFDFPKIAGAIVSGFSNWLNGFHFTSKDNKESVAYHSSKISKMSIGQEIDMLSHRKKYDAWLENPKKEKGLILWGVSRGTATTFCAMAKQRYPEVKLIILEGAIDSVKNVLHARLKNTFKSQYMADKCVSTVSSGLSLFTSWKDSGPSPLKMVAEFPENIPVVFITSAVDKEVPYSNTENIATSLAARGKNDVYLLKLKHSSHPNYMFDDKEDRDTYEAFIHAIYEKYHLKHNPLLAANGKKFIDDALITQDRLTDSYKIFKNKREQQVEILNNMRVLKLRDSSIIQILNAVADNDRLKDVLLNFTTITAKNSKRENYYQYSDYIAEFFCTLSNAGFFAVGCYYNDYTALAAGIFSALSHAIPTQRLHDLDLMGVLLIGMKAFLNYELIIENSNVLGIAFLALAINGLDKLITASHLDKTGPTLHVLWHLIAAFALYVFNEAQLQQIEFASSYSMRIR